MDELVEPEEAAAAEHRRRQDVRLSVAAPCSMDVEDKLVVACDAVLRLHVNAN